LGKVKWSIGRTTWCAEILAQAEGLSWSKVCFLASLTKVGALSMQCLCDVVQVVQKRSTTGWPTMCCSFETLPCRWPTVWERPWIALITQTPKTNWGYEYADRFRTFLLANADDVQETFPPNGEGTLTGAVVYGSVCGSLLWWRWRPHYCITNEFLPHSFSQVSAQPLEGSQLIGTNFKATFDFSVITLLKTRCILISYFTDVSKSKLACSKRSWTT
jgi:hypothetical protein